MHTQTITPAYQSQAIMDLELSPVTILRLQKQRLFRQQQQQTFNHLSKREVEIMALICQGKTNLQISDKLHLSVNTVRTHRNNIWRTLGIKTAVEAVWWGECFDLV